MPTSKFDPRKEILERFREDCEGGWLKGKYVERTLFMNLPTPKGVVRKKVTVATCELPRKVEADQILAGEIRLPEQMFAIHSPGKWVRFTVPRNWDLQVKVSPNVVKKLNELVIGGRITTGVSGRLRFSKVTVAVAPRLKTVEVKVE